MTTRGVQVQVAGRQAFARRLQVRPNWRRPTTVCKSQVEGALSTTPTDLLRSPAKKTSPSVLFPWHHSLSIPSRLLERERNPVPGLLNSPFFISVMTAGSYMNLPIWRMPGQGWRRNLAESCSWAFFQGLHEMMSNVYEGASQ
jgi:hypothetical protein